MELYIYLRFPSPQCTPVLQFFFGQMNSCIDKVQIQNKVDSVNGASHTVLMCMNNSLRAEDDPGRAVSSARVPSKILERQMWYNSWRTTFRMWAMDTSGRSWRWKLDLFEHFILLFIRESFGNCSCPLLPAAGTFGTGSATARDNYLQTHACVS